MNEVEQQILDLLPNNGTRLSGSQIKATLGIMDHEYKDAKQVLKDQGLVILGRGRSGTIALAEPGSAESDSQQKIVSIGERASAALWKEVERRIEMFGCKCELEPNMTFEQLMELEAGCTGTIARRKRGIDAPGWVCSVLDYYRVKMHKFKDKQENDS